MNTVSNQLETVLRTRTLPGNVSPDALARSLETLLGTSSFIICTSADALLKIAAESLMLERGAQALTLPAILPRGYRSLLDLDVPFELFDIGRDLRPEVSEGEQLLQFALGPTGRSAPGDRGDVQSLLSQFVTAEADRPDSSACSMIGLELGVPELSDVLILAGPWALHAAVREHAAANPTEPWQNYAVLVLLSRWLSSVTERRLAARALEDSLSSFEWLSVAAGADANASAVALRLNDGWTTCRAPHATDLQRALLRHLRRSGIRASLPETPLHVADPWRFPDELYSAFRAAEIALSHVIVPWATLLHDAARFGAAVRSFDPAPFMSYRRPSSATLAGSERFTRIFRTRERSWPIGNDLAGRRFRRELAVCRDVSDGKPALVIGSGDGRYHLPLVRLGLEIEGLDYRLSELEAAEEEWSRRGGVADALPLRFADLRRLPYEDLSREAVIVPALDTLSHPWGVLREACRVLAPEGTLILGYRNRSALHSAGRGLPLRAVRLMLAECGLGVVQNTGFGLLCPAELHAPSGAPARLAARLGEEFGGLTVDEVISSQPWALPFAGFHLLALRRDAAGELTPHHGDRRQLEYLIERCDMWNSPGRQASREEGRALWASGSDNEAIDLWLSLLRESPDDPLLLIDLARIVTFSARAHRALDRFEMQIAEALPRPFVPEPEPEPVPVDTGEPDAPEPAVEAASCSPNQTVDEPRAQVTPITSPYLSNGRVDAPRETPKGAVRLDRNIIAGTVSVILPITGEPPHLRETVESILQQSMERLELVVVPWALGSEAKRYLTSITDARVSVFDADAISRAEAVNLGLGRSRGEFVSWVQAGTIFDSEWLAVLLEGLSYQRDATFAYGAMAWHDGDGKQIRPAALPPFTYPTLLTKRPRIGAFLYRRVLHQECGRYDVTVSDLEDWEMWLRVQRTQRVVGVLRQVCTIPNAGDGVPQHRVLELGKRIIDRELTRTGGRFELELLYPGVVNTTDVGIATWHALLDLGARFIESDFIPPGEAVAVLEQARVASGSHPLVLANLVLALLKCARGEEAARLLHALRENPAAVQDPRIRTLVDHFEELSAVPPAEVKGIRMVEAESELLRCDKQAQLRYRPGESEAHAAHA